MAGRDPYDDGLRDAPLHVLLTALSEGSADERYMAATRLYERAALQAVTWPALLDVAARGPTDLAWQALGAIGAGGFGEHRKPIVDRLLALTRGPDPLVRLGAAMAIWRTTGVAQLALREIRRALRGKDGQLLVYALVDCQTLGREARALSDPLERLAGRSGPELLPSIAAALFRVGAGIRAPARILAPVLRRGTYEQQRAALRHVGPMPEVARALIRPISDIAEGRTSAPESLREDARQVQLCVRGFASRRPRRRS